MKFVLVKIKIYKKDEEISFRISFLEIAKLNIKNKTSVEAYVVGF